MSAAPVPVDVLVHLRRARDHADRHFAEPVDLEVLAGLAGMSKWHFHRLFTRAYGVTPAVHVSQRRIERARDLLRATTLSVTEVCRAGGFSSLGFFSSRFRAVVGESPSEFQARWGAAAPRIPGCFVLVAGLVETRRAGGPTSASPSQPELQVNLAVPGPPMSPDLVEAVNRALDGGGMAGLGLTVDDCRATVADLKAKGVEFVQDPQERPYGVEAVCRDSSGNWMVLVEQRPYDPAAMEAAAGS